METRTFGCGWVLKEASKQPSRIHGAYIIDIIQGFQRIRDAKRYRLVGMKRSYDQNHKKICYTRTTTELIYLIIKT